MSESDVQESPQEAPPSLDLAACMRVLAEQQRKSEEASRAEREAEEAERRRADAEARTMAAYVLAQLPAVLEASSDAWREVSVGRPPLARDDGPFGLACQYLDAYFGFNTTDSGWQFYTKGAFTVARSLLVERIKQMADEASPAAMQPAHVVRDDG